MRNSSKRVLTRREYIERHAVKMLCPKHGGNIPNSWVKMTCYCYQCNQYWRLNGRTWGWKLIWFPLTDAMIDAPPKQK